MKILTTLIISTCFLQHCSGHLDAATERTRVKRKGGFLGPIIGGLVARGVFANLGGRRTDLDFDPDTDTASVGIGKEYTVLGTGLKKGTDIAAGRQGFNFGKGHGISFLDRTLYSNGRKNELDLDAGTFSTGQSIGLLGNPNLINRNRMTFDWGSIQRGVAKAKQEKADREAYRRLLEGLPNPTKSTESAPGRSSVQKNRNINRPPVPKAQTKTRNSGSKSPPVQKQTRTPTRRKRIKQPSGLSRRAQLRDGNWSLNETGLNQVLRQQSQTKSPPTKKAVKHSRNGSKQAGTRNQPAAKPGNRNSGGNKQENNSKPKTKRSRSHTRGSIRSNKRKDNTSKGGVVVEGNNFVITRRRNHNK